MFRVHTELYNFKTQLPELYSIFSPKNCTKPFSRHNCQNCTIFKTQLQDHPRIKLSHATCGSPGPPGFKPFKSLQNYRWEIDFTFPFICLLSSNNQFVQSSLKSNPLYHRISQITAGNSTLLLSTFNTSCNTSQIQHLLSNQNLLWSYNQFPESSHQFQNISPKAWIESGSRCNSLIFHISGSLSTI